MKFSELTLLQRLNIYILNPEWMAINYPAWYGHKLSYWKIRSLRNWVNWLNINHPYLLMEINNTTLEDLEKELPIEILEIIK